MTIRSIGTIIWECMVQSFPFSTPPKAAQDKSLIRKKLAEGNLPWDISLSQEADRYSIVRDCWNPNPTLRPSAAFVAQIMLDILVRELVQAPSAPVAPHDVLVAIKERVSRGIRCKKEGNAQVSVIDPEDVRILRQSADLSIDPISSFLLGTAKLYDLIPEPTYDQGDIDEGMGFVVYRASSSF
jgi:hypothetical protein